MNQLPSYSTNVSNPAINPPPASSNSKVLWIVGLVVGGLFLLLVICGGIAAAVLIPAVSGARDAAVEAQFKNDLRNLGIAYHVYMTQSPSSKGPEAWSSLVEIGAISESQVASLKERQVAVVWGLSYPEMELGPIPISEIVMAYPTDAALDESETVPVLMGDGSVQDLGVIEIRDRIEAWNNRSAPEKSLFE